MIQFDFSAPGRIVFGCGAAASLAQVVKSLGKTRILVVNGAGGAIGDTIITNLENSGILTFRINVNHEPDQALIEFGIKDAALHSADCVIGLGGGSAMDTAKAIAVMTTNPGRLLDYVEVVGQGKTIANPGLPLITIPTTAGTGSEVTRNAVIGIPEHKVKVSLRSPHLLAKVALVDPELTLSLPKPVTASTGMDALTQLIEAYVSRKANHLTDMLCRDGITRAAASLLDAYHKSDSIAAREGMSWASLLSGMALANAGLGAVHGFAGPIGGMFNAPHGVICASLLPAVVKANIKNLGINHPDHPSLGKYQDITRILCQNPHADISDGINWLEELCATLSIPQLRDLGIERRYFNEIVEKAMSASSMKGNPIDLEATELIEILEQSY